MRSRCDRVHDHAAAPPASHHRHARVIGVVVFRGEVDPAAVGAWQIAVPNNRGVAQWFWTIQADGQYRFRSDGPGAATAHEGAVTFAGRRWTLRTVSGLPGWEDGGTYEVRDDTFVITGKLGTGVWRRTADQGTPQSTSREGEGAGAPGVAQ